MGDFTNRVSSKNFVKYAVSYLNELLADDPSVAAVLVPSEDPAITEVSVVGVINSILAQAGSHEFLGHCCDEDGQVFGFQVVSASAVEKGVRLD